MAVDDFRTGLEAHFDRFRRTLATDAGDWAVKGFIDAYKNIYTIKTSLAVGTPRTSVRFSTSRLSSRAVVHSFLMVKRSLTTTG